MWGEEVGKIDNIELLKENLVIPTIPEQAQEIVVYNDDNHVYAGEHREGRDFLAYFFHLPLKCNLSPPSSFFSWTWIQFRPLKAQVGRPYFTKPLIIKCYALYICYMLHFII